MMPEDEDMIQYFDEVLSSDPHLLEIPADEILPYLTMHHHFENRYPEITHVIHGYKLAMDFNEADDFISITEFTNHSDNGWNDLRYFAFFLAREKSFRPLHILHRLSQQISFGIVPIYLQRHLNCRRQNLWKISLRESVIV